MIEACGFDMAGDIFAIFNCRMTGVMSSAEVAAETMGTKMIHNSSTVA